MLVGWVDYLLAFMRIRLAYGAMLIAVLFAPFGIYHTMVEPYASGALFGFMLPVGYVAAASGVAMILFPRSTFLKRLGLGYLLTIIGVIMLLSAWIYPRELSISILYGTSMIDLDYSIFTGAVVWLSFLNIAAGLAIRATGFNHRIRKA
jgi:hypothetical protein